MANKKQAAPAAKNEPDAPASEELPALDGAAILQQDDHVRRKVPVPEWGGCVWVRTLTGAERDAWDEFQLSLKENGLKDSNLRATLVVMTACNENGERLWSDDQVPAVSKKNYLALDRVFEAADELNGLSPVSQAKLAKNSQGDRSGDSGTSSPDT